MHRRLQLLALSIVALALLVTLYLLGLIRFNYPSKDEFPIRGIDVSHHQGIIDWRKVSARDITFAFIKATEGGDFKDSRFRANWQDARKEGLVTGAYHFFTFCRPGADQAANFIASVPRVAETLAPVVDLEFVGNCSQRPIKERFIKELSEYIERIESHYGVKPVFYTAYGFHEQYLKTEELEQYAIWIRDIFRRPKQLGHGKWVFWQYADRGRVEGIQGPVDLNVFSGSMEEFKELLIQEQDDR